MSLINHKYRAFILTTLNAIIPKNWHAEAHTLWLQGQKNEAVHSAIAHINTYTEEKPVGISLQLAYYLYLMQDFKSASMILELQYKRTPNHPEIVLNLAVSLAQTGEHEDAIRYALEALKLQPDNFVAYDVLAKEYRYINAHEKANEAGTKSLEIKDKSTRSVVSTLKFPVEHPKTYTLEKTKVISFSLWGSNLCYLRGALQNLLLAPYFFPDWTLRFYIDESVPEAFVNLMRTLNAQVIVHEGEYSIREKLCWRFTVANDTSVGYFLVRDVDSIFSVRETLAVNAWLASDKWFHVIRDWWTHTDLMLAGMWGGVAGILPSLATLVTTYNSNNVETPNVDQWFLRDKVWPMVRDSCLVHDRFFKMHGSMPIPAPEPLGSCHIGQDEFAAHGKAQAQFLDAWIKQYPCLA